MDDSLATKREMWADQSTLKFKKTSRNLVSLTNFELFEDADYGV